MKIWKYALGGLLVFLVSGCMATTALQMGGAPHPFDGKWQGLMRLSIGTADCVRRLGMNVTVQNGKISGRVLLKDKPRFIDGFLADDGGEDRFKIRHSTRFYDYKFVGKFAEETAKGTWKSRDCAGSWSLRKVGV